MDKKLQDEFVRLMKNEVESKDKDIELSHVNADHLLCLLLWRLGYSEVVKEWRKVAKWYS